MSRKTERLYNPRTPEVYTYQSAEAMDPAMPYSRGQKIGAIGLSIAYVFALQEGVSEIADRVTAIVQQQQAITADSEQLIELYQDADVAVVAFGIHPEVATDVAEDIEDTFNTMSDGLITVDVDVVTPTTEAYQHYYDTNDEGCINKGDVTTYGSYIAEETMPELKEYDKILALNSDPACQENIAGVASSLNSRYSEVFNASSSWSAIQQNGGEQTLLTDNENGTQFASFLSSPVSTGVHELYHLFGLGHMGILSTKAEVREDIETLKTYSEKPKAIDFDIRTAISQKNYSEYGDPGVMGQGIMEYSKELSIVERYLIEKPYRQLGREASVEEFDINKQSASFDFEGLGDSVAVYRFDASIEMKGNEYTYGFNRLVLVPQIGADSSKDTPIPYIEAYLMDDGNNIASLGRMINVNDQTTTYTLNLDGESIEAVIDYEASRIRIRATE